MSVFIWSRIAGPRFCFIYTTLSILEECNGEEEHNAVVNEPCQGIQLENLYKWLSIFFFVLHGFAKLYWLKWQLCTKCTRGMFCKSAMTINLLFIIRFEEFWSISSTQLCITLTKHNLLSNASWQEVNQHYSNDYLRRGIYSSLLVSISNQKLLYQTKH